MAYSTRAMTQKNNKTGCS